MFIIDVRALYAPQIEFALDFSTMRQAVCITSPEHVQGGLDNSINTFPGFQPQPPSHETATL
jgi:hypothetical protein